MVKGRVEFQSTEETEEKSSSWRECVCILVLIWHSYHWVILSLLDFHFLAVNTFKFSKWRCSLKCVFVPQGIVKQ